MLQTTNHILMVRPTAFKMNAETAVNNYFQKEINATNANINAQAQEEFDAFVKILQQAGVNVLVVSDVPNSNNPDSVFPNNWVSFHQDGTVALYPMFAENRRGERREETLAFLESQGFIINEIVDYTAAEEAMLFLEGTGSLLLDRVNKIAYCALSPRADEDLVIEFCEDFEYTPILFTANQTVQGKRLPIYHTNVMMCLAETFAVICLECIDDKKEQREIIKQLQNTNKEIITITEAQMHQFAGNMLQVKGANNQLYLVMSQAAKQSLTNNQIEKIEAHCPILSSPLTTIETCGGGSARCMMAEVFLPKQA